MFLGLKKAAFLGFCISLVLCGTIKTAAAQEDFLPALTKFTTGFGEPDLPQPRPTDSKTLLLLMGAQIHETDLDCSHFVQYLYQQAGLYYGYAPSRTLYDGMEGFRRVSHPEAGDLIVWRGHVGIVVDPERVALWRKNGILRIALLEKTRTATLLSLRRRPGQCLAGMDRAKNSRSGRR
jgi:hypothetical protein